MLDEDLIRFSDAAKEFPGRPSLATLHRWRLRGVRGIKLETLLIGGKRFTSFAALDRFARKLTAATASHSTSPRTTKRRQREIRRAGQDLRRENI